MKKWLRITYRSTFSCFIDPVATDSEVMGNMKSSEVYQHLHNISKMNKNNKNNCHILLKEVGQNRTYLLSRRRAQSADATLKYVSFVSPN